MMGIIILLHNVLNRLKGFDAGYSSSHGDKMVLLHEGKYYLLKLEELPEVVVTDKDRVKYKSLEDKFIKIDKYLGKLAEL